MASTVNELTGLIRQILRREAKGKCSACGRGTEDKVQLEQEIHKVMETMDKLNIELTNVKEKLKTKVLNLFFYLIFLIKIKLFLSIESDFSKIWDSPANRAQVSPR